MLIGTKLADFYNSLITRGKPKMVAIVALARKMIVILNAKLRDFYASSLVLCW